VPSAKKMMVVAGEASGDEWAGPIVTELGAQAFGLGGSRLAAAGCELLAEASRHSAMGLGPALLRAPRLVSLGLKLLAEARRRRPQVALLAGYSEFNGWLGPRLRALGVRVLWLAPPQVWAWRPGRARRYVEACDRMAVLLPFEQRLWRELGADAHFVGHPATAAPLESKEHARQRLGVRTGELAVALLPGSRPHELERHLGPMLQTARQLRARHAARSWVLLGAELTPALARRVRQSAGRAGADCLEPGSDGLLAGFDAALVKSGTGSLKCALAGASPVIVYRTGPVAELVLRPLLRVSSIGLPNILLGRKEFPELAGCRVKATDMQRELERLVSEKDRVARAERELRRLLEPPGLGSTGESPARRAARLMETWFA
jgi:lipid-A-disaccharide synthase